MSNTEQMQGLERTAEKITAGIVNIPLTKPAFLFFNKTKDEMHNTMKMLDSFNLRYNVQSARDRSGNNVFHIRTTQEVSPQTLKQVWRNYKSYRPHIETQYRYLFWEIDTREQDVLQYVLGVYRQLDLPIVFHPSMRGYHFISIKPIDVQTWKKAIGELRYTNIDYPPLTLRIKPNKYLGEVTEFNRAMVVSTAYHSDSVELKNWIHTQQIDKIAQKYYVVYYRFPDSQDGDCEC